MARMGIFNRNDNSLTPVSRSLQYLNHSHTTTLPYGQITPIFYEELLPSERISVNVTNLLRSIPMKTPMLSRVKCITRFYAVPKRILWLGYEEYIDGVKDAQFNLTEPYIANFNAIRKNVVALSDGVADYSDTKNLFSSKASLATDMQVMNIEQFKYVNDLSPVGIGLVASNNQAHADGISYTRALMLRDNSDGNGSVVDENTDLIGYQFFPHELGDYFNAPLFATSLGSDTTGRFSAYPFACYQLAYSYGYRNANVQDRVDDMYEMSTAPIMSSDATPWIYADGQRMFPEYPSFFSFFDVSATSRFPLAPAYNAEIVPPVSLALGIGSSTATYKVTSNFVAPASIFDQAGLTYSSSLPVDRSQSAAASDILVTSWKNVEHFPLKGGANIVMQAMNFTDRGTPELLPSRISLTRLRYANWPSDRFTEANPWQQRGDEARIPVVGTVQFDGLTISASGTPEGTVTSTFVGDALSFSATPQGTVTSTFNGVPASLGTGHVLAPRGHNDYTDDFFLSTTGALNVETGFYELSRTGADIGVVNNNPESFVLDGETPFKADIPSSITPQGTVTSTFTGSSITSSATPQGTVTSTFTGSPMTFSGTVQAGGTVSGLYVSPSSFRFAMQLQKIKEMSSRTDGRFKSFLSMFYGARSRDARLDRPEFIGGSVQSLSIDQIEQTSETSQTPLGTLAGRAFSAKKSHMIDYRASEHTCIIGLVHILPDSEYIGGLDRTRHLTNPFDTPMPQFAGLSEQPIRMAELTFRSSMFASLDNEQNEETFGFEPRYNELRAKHSYATGAFRDYWNYTGSREYYKPWLITRQFGYKVEAAVFSLGLGAGPRVASLVYEVPSLSDKFLSTRYSVDYSNFEVTDPEIMMPFMLDSYFDVRWVRVVPTRGIPKI